MELAIGAGPTDEGIKVMCLDGDGAVTTRDLRLLADGGGLPQKKRDRMFFETNFASWKSSSFESYCEALAAKLPEDVQPRHQVFAVTTADGTEVHIPAAAMMQALFRPAAQVMKAAFTAVNLDQLAHIHVDGDLPVVRVRSKGDGFPSSALANGSDRYLRWLFASASGRACVQSVHLRALHGWLDLSLPKGLAKFGVHGVRSGSAFYATAVTVHWVEVPDTDNLTGQDEVHFLHRTEPLCAMEAVMAGVPAVRDDEWPALAAALPHDAERDLVDLMMTRLRRGHWPRAASGRVAKAGRLLQSWHEGTVLQTLVGRLESMRLGVWKIDGDRAQRLGAPAGLTREVMQTKTNSRSGTVDVFLDTEFSTDVHGGVQLLSLGLCSSTGEEFYREVALPEAPIGGGQFLEEHVFPQLGRPDALRGSFIEVGRDLASWLSSLGRRLNVCYDFSLDCQFIEQLLELVPGELTVQLEPTHVGYLLEDDAGSRAAEASWAQTEATRGIRRHHALADALALRARFLAVHPI